MSKQKNKKTPRINQLDLSEFLVYLKSPGKILYTNFLAGIARGFGFVMGATVVVALVALIVSKILSQIPVVGQFFEWLDDFLQESLKNKMTT